jgi:hypothetical protein
VHVVCILEWCVGDVLGIAMRDRVQKGRNLPSDRIEVVVPVRELNLAVEHEQEGFAHMKCMASLKDCCRNEADSRVLE